MPKTPDRRAPDGAGTDETSDGQTLRGRSSAKSGALTQPAHDQLGTFQSAMRLFHAGRFREARAQFEKALEGENRTVSNRAELHIRMCDRRLQDGLPELKSAEDHYNYAVALINSRELQKALKHLDTALALDPDADHIHYAAALCRGLAGDLQGAYENLKRAIELQPRNRVAARQDADFASIADKPPLDRLLYPERKTPGF